MSESTAGLDSASRIADRSYQRGCSFSASARLHLGRLRLGPTVDLRPGTDSSDVAYAAGLTAAWQLPRFHPRIDTEIAAELGVERISVTPERDGRIGTSTLAFWSALPGVQAAIAIALTPALAAVVGVRVDGVPAHGVDADTEYCGATCEARTETWQVGGLSYGVAAGLRFSM